jgi:PilZ domain-containing protein
MAWVIVIAAFLGTMVAVLFLFFALTDRKETGQAGKEQRMEERVPVTGNLELSSLDEPSISCTALAENASRHGARLIVKKPWQPNREVLVRLPGWDRPSPARIVYCKALPGDVCALGLQMISDTGGENSS